jgi:hypothetical protein
MSVETVANPAAPCRMARFGAADGDRLSDCERDDLGRRLGAVDRACRVAAQTRLGRAKTANIFRELIAGNNLPAVAHLKVQKPSIRSILRCSVRNWRVLTWDESRYASDLGETQDELPGPYAR